MTIKIETINGSSFTREIDMSDSPITILKKCYEEDPTTASMVFANEKAIDQLVNSGIVDEEKSGFELVDASGSLIKADWKQSLCEQPAIKEALSELEAEGKVPTFSIAVTSVVAAA